MTAILERLREKMQGEKGIRLIVILGLTGMALILISGFLPEQKASQKEAPSAQEEAVSESADQYRAALEERLTNLLSQMAGIGKAEVMITLSGSSEQIYAEEVRSNKSDHSSQREASYVITKSGGNESALVTETRYPAVIGAIVLCTNGDHAAVQEAVTRAVSTVLGIPASSVFVGKTGSV
ncbi:MAG: hypothetical protein IJ060_07770 [Oscillospiraceae bacterium]|nr:hypothetical protein [Oscillospiraceae bacterium]